MDNTSIQPVSPTPTAQPTAAFKTKLARKLKQFCYKCKKDKTFFNIFFFFLKQG